MIVGFHKEPPKESGGYRTVTDNDGWELHVQGHYTAEEAIEFAAEEYHSGFEPGLLDNPFSLFSEGEEWEIWVEMEPAFHATKKE